MPETTHTSPVQTPAMQSFQRYKLPIAVAILVIFHGVGFWGLLFSGEPESFQSLTPLNLLLTNVLLFSFHKKWDTTFIIFALTVAVAGFMAEVVGVHTGLLFGNYTYGATLGTKLWEVPLLIGINWLMLVYTTGHIANYTRLHWLVKAALGALLMVVLDFFMEPVAMQYDFWNWKEQLVPLSNYTGWLGLAFLLQMYFQQANIYKKNRLAPYVYLVQLLFFIGLWGLL